MARPRKKKAPARRTKRRPRWLVFLAMLALSGALIWAVVEMTRRAPRVAAPAARATPEITDKERRQLRDVIESLDGSAAQ